MAFPLIAACVLLSAGDVDARDATPQRSPSPSNMEKPVPPKLSSLRRLSSEELSVLLSDVVMSPGSTITLSFYKNGRFLMMSEVPVWGTFRVEKGTVCTFVEKKQMECMSLYEDGSGNYFTSGSSKKSNKRFPVTISRLYEVSESTHGLELVSGTSVVEGRQLLNSELTDLFSDVIMSTGSTVEHRFYKDGRYFIDAEVSSRSHFEIVRNRVCVGSSVSPNCMKIYKTDDGKYHAAWSSNDPNKRFEVRFRPIKD